MFLNTFENVHPLPPFHISEYARDQNNHFSPVPSLPLLTLSRVTLLYCLLSSLTKALFRNSD